MAKLTEIMARMLKDAREVNRPVKVKLKHGLNIKLGVFGGQVVLYLSRKGVEPSLQEWITVLKSFPELPRDSRGRRPDIGQKWTNEMGFNVIRGRWALKDMRETEGMEWVK